MIETGSSPARERVLQVAEQLFSERGYNSVTLRDIADALGMKQASLYNHAPSGKEGLYIAVTQRGLDRNHANLERVLSEASPNLRAQLRAAANWLLSQPPMNLARMSSSDMPSINPSHAERLEEQLYCALFQPIIDAIEQAYQRGETRLIVPALLAGLFITAIESLHHVHQYTTTPKEVLAHDIIDMLLDGVLRHPS